MKTIFITSFHGLISRNIFQSEAFEVLKNRPDLKLAVFIPDYKFDFFQKNFGGGNVIFEKINPGRASKIDFIFKFIFSALLATNSVKLKRREKLDADKKYFSFFVSSLVSSVFGRVGFLKSFFRWIYGFIPSGKFSGYFEKYKPDLVFCSDIQNENDILMLKEAKKRKIKSLGMVRSWDNLTCKEFIKVVPDKMIVNNEILKKEAQEHHGIDPEKIFVCGIPHYDAYVRQGRAGREDFCRGLDLDPAKKIILYAPAGDRYIKNNNVDWQILDILQKEFLPDAQILARLPPADTGNLDGFQKKEGVIFDRPGKIFHEGAFKEFELSRHDEKHLIDSIFQADLIICGPSTIAIDAFVFDKPVIFIAFDGREKREYIRGIGRYYDYEHVLNIIKRKGAVLARNQEELVQGAKRYLADPSLDKENRRKIIEDQCWKLDGRSGKRLAEYILKHIFS